MDMHMPEMDGIDATRRNHERLPENERPWIIALTANDMQTDREACLHAGKRAFVTRPVQRIPRRENEIVVWTPPDYLEELRHDDSDGGTELVRIFLEDTSRQILELETALEEHEFTRAGKLLHSFKGSTAQMGALELAALCASLEADIAAADSFAPRVPMEALKAAHVSLVILLESYLDASRQVPSSS